MSLSSITNLFNVDGLVAVITGGGTGMSSIGLMMAKALEENGAKVYIVGRRLDVLENAAKEAKHGNILPLQGDVTSKEDLSLIVDKITAETGYINVLIANSGIVGPGIPPIEPNTKVSDLRESLWKTDAQAFANTLEINTGAVFFSVVAFLSLLEAGNVKGNVEQKSQVIATTSIGGFNRVPLAGFAYATSKAGTTHMMKQFSTMLIPFGIRSNVIAPGFYPSEMTSEGLKKFADADGLLPEKLVPLRRAGDINDMAGTILYLTSRAGAYLNGNVVVTDGGRLSSLPSTY